ncbi:chorismate mutase [Desulfotomaculum arcticum]|uniref:chorismate mutase n=1 Tax=Desulfotruncus arcticus DSM 17038 TaxID=1121424 RepID=A0A1I2MU77_9FIRM|nr:chorismate mutase [Desulfotruncus arcticus]SFF94688.1 chorismate mutase [Desulfotomaculum arcticum] [Desulfotruncus arcticus DSM 17038]
MRGIRGAISVEKNTREAMGKATKKLLLAVMDENKLKAEDIISVTFTLTKDLNAAFPAACARELPGWNYIPMLCAVEVDVPGSLSSCLRVLVHADIEAGQREVKHVYLDEAVRLRPDLKE